MASHIQYPTTESLLRKIRMDALMQSLPRVLDILTSNDQAGVPSDDDVYKTADAMLGEIRALICEIAEATATDDKPPA